jgi:hypothetical protein
MKRALHRLEGKSGLELLEEATHLLRTLSPAALASYYVGTLPLVLGVLYFCADMSRSPFADQHLASASLGLAALFLWMKFWQSYFIRNVRSVLSGSPPPVLTGPQRARILATQAALQPLGLFLLPLAFILTLPSAWVYAFFQNLTVLSDGDTSDLRPLVSRSIRQARLWPRQNHVVFALLLTFGFCVFLNWATLCFILPGLVKMLFGIESVFTRNPITLLNTTFFAVIFGMTYLCVDPIAKAVYALRCFYGESLASGEDLKSELKQFSALNRMAACLLLLLALAATGSTARAIAWQGQSEGIPALLEATQDPPTRSPASVSPDELERAIKQVAQESKYAWRMPREKLAEAENDHQGVIDRFLDRAGKMVRQWLKDFGQWLDRWMRKLFFRQRQFGSGGSGYGWIMTQELLIYGLAGAALLALGYVAYRIWQNRAPKKVAVASEPILPVPDLRDENLGAEQLPEDGWTRLARELLAKGELRLALRAFYLASLAHLAQRNLIRLEKFKSNHEYERELRRRAHSLPALLSAFGENVISFDRSWYGLHQIDSEQVGAFAANLERMRACQ